MNKPSLRQITGSLTVMFSALFLLIFAAKLKDVNLADPGLSDKIQTTLRTPIDPTGKYKTPPPPGNIITGSINPSADGNIVFQSEEKPEKVFHYKAIRSDVLKNRENNLILKLEVKEDGKTLWKETAWNWINYDQGTLYFHYKTSINGTDSKPAEYTGNYQIIIQSPQ